MRCFFRLMGIWMLGFSAASAFSQSPKHSSPKSGIQEAPLKPTAIDCDRAIGGNLLKREIEEDFLLYLDLLKLLRSKAITASDSRLQKIRLRLIAAVEHNSVNCFGGVAQWEVLCAQLTQNQPILNTKNPGQLSIPFNKNFTWISSPRRSMQKGASSWRLVQNKTQTTYASLSDRNADLVFDRMMHDQGYEFVPEVNEGSVLGLKWNLRETVVNGKAPREVNWPQAPSDPKEACLGGYYDPNRLFTEMNNSEGWSPAAQSRANSMAHKMSVLQGFHEGWHSGKRGVARGLIESPVHLAVAVGQAGIGAYNGAVEVLASLMVGGYLSAQSLADLARKFSGLSAQSLAKITLCSKQSSDLTVQSFYSCLGAEAAELAQKMSAEIHRTTETIGEVTSDFITSIDEKIGTSFAACRASHGYLSLGFSMCLKASLDYKSFQIAERIIRGLYGAVKDGLQKCFGRFDERFSECMGEVAFTSLSGALGFAAGTAAKAQAAVLPASSAKRRMLEKVGEHLGYNPDINPKEWLVDLKKRLSSNPSDHAQKKPPLLEDSGRAPKGVANGSPPILSTARAPLVKEAGVEVYDIPHQSYTSQTRRLIRDGKGPRYYAKDVDGNLVVMDEIPNVDAETGMLFLKNADGSNVAIREIGELSWDPNLGRVINRPHSNFNWGDNGLDEVVKTKLAKDGVPAPESKFPKGRPMSRVLQCEDVAGTKMGKFLRDGTVASMVVTTVGLGVGELMGANRFASEEQVQTILAENVAGIPQGIAAGSVGYMTSKSKSMGNLQKLSIRTGTGLVLIHAWKKPIVESLSIASPDEEAVNEAPPDSAAKQIANFDTAYGLGRVPLDKLLDEKLFLGKLEDFIKEKCLAGEKISIFQNSQSIRIYERATSTILYFALRSSTIGQ